ncbi:hypothetical protein [Sphingomonas sp. Leaf205]|uniref:hypothetical protein n=1 Tax=Sphingomonas sp. Leaf205 TaxID=2876551 RepID=UPI001E3776F7|nr:hypothetical protein [Sphingomonas sp. Leaf205]
MADTCFNCGRSLSLGDRLCTYCSADVLPPNVRSASRAGEVAALAERETEAIKAAASNGATDVLMRLRTHAEESRLVINRKLRSLSLWVNSEDELYLNFYQLKKRGVKSVDDRYNRQRVSAENTVSPGFYEELTVGALTVDGEGMSYYGPWSVIVRDDHIRLRASVFWSNPFLLLQSEKVISGDDLPEGFRAPWSARSRLAVAKLGSRLSAADDDDAIATRFMGPDRSSEHCDFIEVHVHHEIHVDGIERIKEPALIPPIDRTEWEFLREKLSAKGVVC